MPSLDIFQTNRGFSMMDMSLGIDKMDYKPSVASRLGAFTQIRVSTTTVMIEKRDMTLSVIPTSLRGETVQASDRENREIFSFVPRRIRKRDVIQASEIQNLRGFGTTDLQATADFLSRRQMKLLAEMELTKEMHRLGVLAGKWVDTDNTEIYDYFSKFNVTEPSALDWSSNASNALADNIRDLKRVMTTALGGLVLGSPRIVGLCGDTAYDFLKNHQDYKEKYLSSDNAAANLLDTNVFDSTDLGGVGITFINYRGNTSIDSKLAIADNTIRFFFTGVPGLFQEIYAPGESMEMVNTQGLPQYAQISTDPKYREFVELDMSSYPLFLCSRPETLQSATVS